MRAKSLLLGLGLGALLLVPGQALAENPQFELSVSIGGKKAGTIRIELYRAKAPKSVANFIKYVKAGHYKGTIFHRVIDNFMVQGGGFTRDFVKKPTRKPIRNEADNGLKNLKGTVAMARTPNPHSASAQFFINVKDNGFLDHTGKSMRGWGYCVFGKVVRGMKLVNRIKKLPTGARGPFDKDVPKQTVMITKAVLR